MERKSVRLISSVPDFIQIVKIVRRFAMSRVTILIRKHACPSVEVSFFGDLLRCCILLVALTRNLIFLTYAEMQFYVRLFFFCFIFTDYLHDRNFVKLSDYAGKLLVKLH